jgi:D-alanyl-lipoteichoic acid acyltransferase DltB (MBOAT superfamily)
MISGLWHGANWTFIIWGALHGIYQIGGIIFKRFNSLNILGYQPLSNFFHILITFILVTVAWIFFRANTVQDALLISKNILTFKSGGLFIGQPAGFLYSILWILFLVLTEYIQENHSERFKVFNNSNVVIRYAGYATLVCLILLFGVFNGAQFIYFQF